MAWFFVFCLDDSGWREALFITVARNANEAMAQATDEGHPATDVEFLAIAA